MFKGKENLKKISLQKNEHSFSTRESFRCTCHNVICDALITQLKKRIEAYIKIDEKYGFLYNKTLPTSEIKKCAEEFQNTFSEDIDDTFADEFLHFGAFFKEKNSPKDCLQKIRNLNISHTFPNMEIAYRLFLTLPITNCSSERSFSVLKRIKSRLRSSMTQKNLQAFSLLTIESDITSKLEFNDIIDAFASKKARKKPF